MKKTGKTKSKIGIWTRIKNIYDNSPYLVGFIISPIVWYFIILLLAIVFLKNKKTKNRENKKHLISLITVVKNNKLHLDFTFI